MIHTRNTSTQFVVGTHLQLGYILPLASTCCIFAPKTHIKQLIRIDGHLIINKHYDWGASSGHSCKCERVVNANIVKVDINVTQGYFWDFATGGRWPPAQISGGHFSSSKGHKLTIFLNKNYRLITTLFIRVISAHH